MEDEPTSRGFFGSSQERLSEGRWRTFSIKEIRSLATVQSFHTLGTLVSFRESSLMVRRLLRVPRGCGELWRYEVKDYPERPRWVGGWACGLEAAGDEEQRGTTLILRPSFLLRVTCDYTTACYSELWSDERCCINAGVKHRSSRRSRRPGFASTYLPWWSHCVMLCSLSYQQSYHRLLCMKTRISGPTYLGRWFSQRGENIQFDWIIFHSHRHPSSWQDTQPA